SYRNFFNDILEPLFYEALAQQRDYNFYSRFNCKIPFLNGGLFDPINNYDWVHIDVILPNELFSNRIETKEGDKGTGILDIFDRYNFTVKEDEPLEKEVAVDPEMLGKVFENLLEAGDRKAQGTFYTPREIVHYMCQESLVSYLSAGLEEYICKNDISKFIKIGELVGEHEQVVISKEKETKDYFYKLPEAIRAHAKQIDEKLASIKVCDPACGSGAFLVGMMSEIVKARNVLSIFIEGGGRSLYDFKRECIENSLYGVDINAGAVEIAKLRLWLSLIVDEEDIEQIKPLPNLDYKIIRGNSLLGIDLNADVNFFNKDSFDKIEQFKNSIIEEISHEKKKNLKEQIDKLILDITGGKKDFDFEIYFSEVFRNNGGFDAVIANPPYIRQEKIKEYKPLLKKYEVYNSTSDIYTYFYEKSWNILKDGGFSCFISSNKWMRAKYGEKLRKFLKSKSAIVDIIDFAGHKVFESATVDTNIIIFQKLKRGDVPSYMTVVPDNTINVLNMQSDFNKEYNLCDYFEKNGLKVKQESLDSNCFTFGSDALMNLKTKIEKIGIPLKDQDVKIYYGIKTGLNEAFIIDTAKRKEILNSCETEKERQMTEEIIKPILRGKDIDKYAYKWADKWVIIAKYESHKYIENEYPAIFNHLKNFEKELKNRGQCKYSRAGKGIGQHHWLELDNNPKDSYLAEFEKGKIVWQRVTQQFKFNIVPRGMYVLDSMAFLTGSNLYYIIGCLNSKLIDFYIRSYVHRYADTGFLLSNQYVERIPLPKISEKEQQPIVNLVDKILQVKAKNPNADTSGFERQIDLLVYKLYNLTEDEINLIENYD
ncbi:MAG: BREX-1 system adenine-specific DNA-methyltransferase PglX, partial [Deltaproteobacteria bacterium]|nr:BREX-1 system adenine-specific DNA-methyltransferase PglX [Deltaproteobacteria bacterium]